MNALIKIMLVASMLVIGPLAIADDSYSTPMNTMQPSSNTNTMQQTQPSTSNQMLSSNDASIVSNVQQKLSENPILKGFNISPTSSNGVVTLDGTVDTPAQENAAINDAKSVNGVTNVKSNIIVKNAST